MQLRATVDKLKEELHMAEYKVENEMPQLKAYITQLEEKLLEKERPPSSYSTATESSVPSSVVTGEKHSCALLCNECF